MPDMVQVGNEITAGVLWPQAAGAGCAGRRRSRSNGSGLRELIAAGCKAVR